VDGICERPDVFLRDEAMVELGVGKNMVRSIRHWCLATRVAEEGEVLPGGGRARGLALTDLGRALFVEPGWDPFLEDDGSLWLIHWNLATNPDRATTWYWGFNRLHEQQFSREAFLSELQRMAEGAGGRGAAVSSLKADVSCFLRTYVAIKRGPTSTLEETLDCPLTTLNLITEVEGDRAYRFNNGPKPDCRPPCSATRCSTVGTSGMESSRRSVCAKSFTARAVRGACSGWTRMRRWRTWTGWPA
jgi:hypothetical protein